MAKKPLEHPIGDVPMPHAHRSSELPEERSPDGHRKDVLATIVSAALLVGLTLLLAWMIYAAFG